MKLNNTDGVNMRLNSFGLSAVAMAYTMVPFGTAHAQATGQQVTVNEATGSKSSVPGDIVVTAQRRQESLQKTALAVTAIKGDKLVEQGVRNPTDLSTRVPSLQISTSGMVYLRGVGTSNVNEASDPTVASHVDGVYLARPSGVLAAGFYDIQRVEVLRGPQGTLYGRNATSGSINIISNQPEFKNSGALVAEIGNYGTLTTSGYGNLAVSRFRGQRLTVDSLLDSTLTFGGSVGRAGRGIGRGMGDHRGSSAR